MKLNYKPARATAPNFKGLRFPQDTQYLNCRSYLGIPSKGHGRSLRCHVEFITIQEILLRSNLARIDFLTD
jgi:hypothetical protein